ncbi:hypothetical protein FQN50_007685 [Emmonsiellopsis sp. PD_5]|nr:hypothetical protein FQN50_007685 [Emmonsiellopsis sp. PD_5]
MEALEETLEVRPLVLERLAKTRVIGRHLNRISSATKDLKQTVLTSQLEGLGIRLSFLDLEGDSGHDMTFYRPLPKEQFPVINWDGVGFSDWTEGYSEESRRVDITLDNISSELWGAWLRNNKQQPWAQYKYYRAGQIATGEYTPNAPYQWQTRGDIEAKSLYIPHCSFRIIHYIDPEEPLRRSEVLPIVAYMKWRIRQFNYVEHYVFPILAISIFRSKARVLQAHHDGRHLHISKSNFYDFKTNIKENYELFARWIHSIPCGDTTTPLNIEGEMLDEHTVKQVDQYLRKTYKLS